MSVGRSRGGGCDLGGIIEAGAGVTSERVGPSVAEGSCECWEGGDGKDFALSINQSEGFSGAVCFLGTPLFLPSAESPRSGGPEQRIWGFFL